MYPSILCFCILGCYSVSNSTIDVWIMLVMGGVGYVLRKFGYDLAPVALGLVLAPMLELSLRQSLAMSAGDYAIFVERPIALTMLGLGAHPLRARPEAALQQKEGLAREGRVGRGSHEYRDIELRTSGRHLQNP